MTDAGVMGVAAAITVLSTGLLIAVARDSAAGQLVLRRFDVPVTSFKSTTARAHSPRWLSKSVPFLALIACLVAALVGGVIVAAIAGVSIILAGRAWRERERSRERERYERMLPLALDSVARHVRSGAGLSIALQEVATETPGRLGDDLGRVTREAALGAGLVGALEGWAERSELPAVRVCVAALCMTVETGAAQAQAMDGVASTLRQAINATEQARTHATDAKASAFALTVLPIVVTGPALLFNADARSFMLGTLVGQLILLAGIGLDAIGAVWMSRLIRRSLS